MSRHKQRTKKPNYRKCHRCGRLFNYEADVTRYTLQLRNENITNLCGFCRNSATYNQTEKEVIQELDIERITTFADVRKKHGSS